MLKSKRDESIKRYLARVGKLEHQSKLYNSRYYKVSYGKEFEIIVRFADHFNAEVKPKDIDIVKTSVGFYVIKTSIGVSATLGEDTIIPYLRSLPLVYPEVSSSMTSFMNASQKAENKSLKNTVTLQKTQYSNLKAKHEKLTITFQRLNALKEQLNTLFG